LLETGKPMTGSAAHLGHVQTSGIADEAMEDSLYPIEAMRLVPFVVPRRDDVVIHALRHALF
jgi:hypothetical protein